MTENVDNTPKPDDEAYQDFILQGVSRTFALTIPVLPSPLVRVVANAYLLCRIADTIEDDKHLPYDEKRRLSERFIRVVAAGDSAESFAADLYPLLSPTATDAERDLVKKTATVIRITHSFNSRQRTALERCIRIMADGMSRYQEENVRNGLKDQEDMDNYCYFVAGVVGEMLTELFCDYSAEIDRHREQLMGLAVSFGQGLQMTNILKDIWDDRKRGMCWLPRDVFTKYGCDLTTIANADHDGKFQQAFGHLIGVARSHLANALQYTLLIPREEQGLRRFCLWAIGMAVLTLRKINTNRTFRSGQEVKISRSSVKATILSTNLLTRHDLLLRWLFKLSAKPLPRVELSGNFSGLAGEV
jgi:farnesyl-diphosphate farnesyltransferase